MSVDRHNRRRRRHQGQRKSNVKDPVRLSVIKSLVKSVILSSAQFIGRLSNASYKPILSSLSDKTNGFDRKINSCQIVQSLTGNLKVFKIDKSFVFTFYVHSVSSC